MARTTPLGPADAAAPRPGGLRERKKRATRQALQQAAVQLIREHGLGAVTVDDICARAEVSPRTFFNYFTAKEEVLVPWDPEVVASTPERVVARPAGEPLLSVVRTVLGEMLETALSGPTWREQALVLREHPELVGRVAMASHDLEMALGRGLAERLGRDGDDGYVRLLAAIGVTTLRVAIESWQVDADASVHEFLDRAFARLDRGLALD